MPDAQALIEQHGDAVWRTAARLLPNPDDARDCYQDTFLAALKLPDPAAVRNWSALLRKIATRRAMDRLRLKYRRKESPAQLDTFPASDRRLDAPGARLEAMELREQVRDALCELPERQAEAFWLRHMEQMTHEQVAEQLETTSANARQLVHRATEALRRKLCPEPSRHKTADNPQALTGEQR